MGSPWGDSVGDQMYEVLTVTISQAGDIDTMYRRAMGRAVPALNNQGQAEDLSSGPQIRLAIGRARPYIPTRKSVADMSTREPGQVRKEAAVPNPPWVVAGFHLLHS